MKSIICGMLISKKNFKLAEMEAKIRNELGDDILDAISLSELQKDKQSESIGFLLTFKTTWQLRRGVFDAHKIPSAGDFETDQICTLRHEGNMRGLGEGASASLLKGKKVLDWERSERLITVVLTVVIGFSAERAFREEPEFNFAITGDHNYLPKAYLKNAQQLARDGKSALYCKLLR